MLKAFTLVELMIVIAIVAILAAIAIPMVAKYQLDAKKTELALNVEGIDLAEQAYNAAYDTFVLQGGYRPDAAPGKTARAWVGNNFDTLGWSPDGDVRGSYRASQQQNCPSEGPSACIGDCIVTTGYTDIDADGVTSCLRITQTYLGDTVRATINPNEH